MVHLHTLLPVSETKAVKKLARSIPIPDVDAFVGKLFSIGRASEEPQQFLHNSSPEDFLRCE